MIDVDCYCTQSRRLSRSLTEAYDRALRPTGLTAAQFSLLRTMSRVDTPTVGAVAGATGLDRTTLRRNFAVMQRKGWITVTSGHHARMRVVTLTANGETALDQALPLWEQAQAETSERLSSQLREVLEEAAEIMAA